MTPTMVAGYFAVCPHRRMLAALAVVATLAGGAGVPPLVVAQAAGGLDGTYSGTINGGVARSARAQCNNVVTTHLHVADGKATIMWNGQLTGTVAPDGTAKLSGSNGSVLEGTIAGGTFKGSLTTSYCSYSFLLTKG